MSLIIDELKKNQQNQSLLYLIKKNLLMPFVKVDLHTGSQNPSSHDGNVDKRLNSTQKINNSGERVSNSQKSLIQRFKQQTQELKEIKKTISTISLSRLNNMQRLKVQKNPEHQSINLYRLSQPQNRESIFKINKSKKVIVNLNFNKNQLQQRKNQEVVHRKLTARDQTEQASKFERIHIKQTNEEHILSEQVSFDEIKEQNRKQMPIKTENYPLRLIATEQRNSLPISNISKKRSFSANHIKNVSNLALIQKKQKLYDTQSNQIQSVSSGFSSPMEMRHRYEERLKQSRAKIMTSKVRIVEGQTNFKLERKIRQNLQLIEKQKTLHELIHTRMQRQRQKAEKLRRKNEQRRLVHESRKMKANIQRAYRKDFESKERQFHRSRSQQTLLNVMYNKYAKEIKEIKKQQLLAYNLQFLKNLQSVEFRTFTKMNNPEMNQLSVLFEE